MFENNTWNNNNWRYSPMQLPHYEIVKVNGEAGARAFQMAPNSSIFLADATNTNLIWLVQTDGAGYLTATPLDVNIHQTQPPIDVHDLEERVKHLESMYEQFNTGSSKSKKQRSNAEPIDATN